MGLLAPHCCWALLGEGLPADPWEGTGETSGSQGVIICLSRLLNAFGTACLGHRLTMRSLSPAESVCRTQPVPTRANALGSS